MLCGPLVYPTPGIWTRASVGTLRPNYFAFYFAARVTNTFSNMRDTLLALLSYHQDHVPHVGEFNPIILATEG